LSHGQVATRDVNSREIAFLCQQMQFQGLDRLSILPEYVGLPFTGVTGIGLPAWAQRGGGDRQPAPDAVSGRCWDPITACGRPIDSRPGPGLLSQNARAGGLWWERDRRNAVADDGSGNRRSPPPHRTPLDNQLMLQADEHVKTAGSSRVSGTVAHLLKHRWSVTTGRDR